MRDIAQRLAEAFNARDLEGLLGLSTEDLRVRSRFSSVADTVFRGPDGIRQWWDDLEEAWDPITIRIEDLAALTDDRLVLLVRLTAHGRGSGVDLDESVGQVWTLRDGLLAEIDYLDREEAERIVRGG